MKQKYYNKLPLFCLIVFSFFIMGCNNNTANTIVQDKSTTNNQSIHNETSTQEDTTIHIAFDTWIGYTSFYIAEKEGLFDQYGIEVYTSVIDPLGEKNAAIIRKDLDGMGGTADSAVISQSIGVNGNIIMLFDKSDGTNGILVDGSIETIEDLKGKKVALEEGFVGHFFLLYVLQKAGIDPSEVEIIPMTTDQAGTAFLAGKVDAAVTWEPLLSQALQRKDAHILVSSADIEPVLVDVLYMSEDFIQQNPHTTQKLVWALTQANELWEKDPEKYLPFVAEKRGWTENEIRETMKTVHLYTQSNQKHLFEKEINQQSPIEKLVQSAADLRFITDVISTQTSTKNLINAEFILTPLP